MDSGARHEKAKATSFLHVLTGDTVFPAKESLSEEKKKIFLQTL